jgi:hypothetical protein
MRASSRPAAPLYFSRRMVNATQNEKAGKALKGFSTYARVLEGDRFLVWIA